MVVIAETDGLVVALTTVGAIEAVGTELGLEVVFKSPSACFTTGLEDGRALPKMVGDWEAPTSGVAVGNSFSVMIIGS